MHELLDSGLFLGRTSPLLQKSCADFTTSLTEAVKNTACFAHQFRTVTSQAVDLDTAMAKQLDSSNRPARCVTDFDNLLLSHADRTRVPAEEHRRLVITVNGIVRGTVLIDGFVGGTWRFERGGAAADVVVSPFAPLRPADRDILAAESLHLPAASDARAAVRRVRVEAR